MSSTVTPPVHVGQVLMQADWSIQTEAALFDQRGKSLDLVLCCTATTASRDVAEVLNQVMAFWPSTGTVALDFRATWSKPESPSDRTFRRISGTLGLDLRPLRDLAMVSVADARRTVNRDRFSENLSLDTLCSRFVELSRFDRVALASNIGESVYNYPIPIFGSPPQGWSSLLALGGAGGYAVVLATLAESGHPVIAGLTVAGSFVIYLAKPSAEVARQNLADRLERRIGLPPKNGLETVPDEIKQLPPSTFY